MKSTCFAAFCASLALTHCLSSSADMETIDGARVMTIVQSELYTGCAAKIDRSVSLVPCTYPNYINFDCDGTFGTSKATANNKFSAAQLALVTQNTMYLRVDDTKVKDGICYADIINVNRQ